MNRRNFLQYAAIAPVSTLAFAKTESPNPNNILNNFENGDIDKIIKAIYNFGPNIFTNLGLICLSSIHTAFYMIELTHHLPKLLVTSPYQYRNICSNCHDHIIDNKLWNVEMLAINHPSLQNKILILPDSNNINNASMIEISEWPSELWTT